MKYLFNIFYYFFKYNKWFKVLFFYIFIKKEYSKSIKKNVIVYFKYYCILKIMFIFFKKKSENIICIFIYKYIEILIKSNFFEWIYYIFLYKLLK